jgi:hypothetical protein
MNRSMVAGAAALALLGGCGWFESSSTTSEKARPGAERQVTASSALPGAGAGRAYDGAVAPVDETRSAPRIGSVVAGKGGQKAQKEIADKEANEREAKAREERARAEREAALKKSLDPTAKPGETPAGTPAAATTPAVTTPADAPTPPAAPAPAAPPADIKQ